MDYFSKRPPMEGELGRIIRNMSLHRMVPLHGIWGAAADIYETDKDIVICMDVAGIGSETLSVTAAHSTVTVSGERHFPPFGNISCVHQLEIERGRFERTFTLPKPIDVSATSSEYKNGILVITLPKLKRQGKVQITVR